MKDDLQKLKKLEAQVALLSSRVNDLELRLAEVEKLSGKATRLALTRTTIKPDSFALPSEEPPKSTRPTRRREPPRI